VLAQQFALWHVKYRPAVEGQVPQIDGSTFEELNRLLPYAEPS